MYIQKLDHYVPYYVVCLTKLVFDLAICIIYMTTMCVLYKSVKRLDGMDEEKCAIIQ